MSNSATEKSFSEIANDTTKRFALESFSFTHQFGLNIYFDDLDDLKSITNDVEFEFWSLFDTSTDAELSVSNFDTLRQILDFLDDSDVDDEKFISACANLVNGLFTTWDNVKDWYSEHYMCDFVNHHEFGHYHLHECSCIELPESLEGYFDYEAYSKDILSNSYALFDGKVFRNH